MRRRTRAWISGLGGAEEPGFGCGSALALAPDGGGSEQAAARRAAEEERWQETIRDELIAMAHLIRTALEGVRKEDCEALARGLLNHRDDRTAARVLVMLRVLATTTLAPEGLGARLKKACGWVGMERVLLRAMEAQSELQRVAAPRALNAYLCCNPEQPGAGALGKVSSFIRVHAGLRRLQARELGREL